ncbi:MAG: 30S ribosomal protein S3 [Gammaproteobacteria bacterium]|jgi:small subunit ribosomal protein S3|nr:30S ribosomal protein S3 [Gammaproteobacteria bacterium]
MGQKVNPKGIRLGIVRDWDSKWYANSKDYPKYLLSDIEVRDFLFNELKTASVSRISIERLSNSAKVTIYTARPGIVIGKKGSDIERLKKLVSEKMGIAVHIAIEEVKQPELDARLVAENIAQQLEKRVMYRRAVKRVLGNATRIGALGIKVMVSGRLNGAEIARSEWYREGRVPLHTFRADVDYSSFRANTQYGVIGIKVWIFKGEILDHKKGTLEEVSKRGPGKQLGKK